MVEKKEQEAEVKEEQVEQEEPKEEQKEEKVEKVEKKAEEKKDPTADLGKKEKKIVESIETLSVMELSVLVKALEEKFGVSAAMPMMAGPMAAGAGAGAAEVEEKSIFDVVLTEIGSNKIQVIKEVRAVSSLGLKEAKDLVEAAPKAVLTGIKKEEAEEIKQKLEAVGAKVELK